VVVVVVVVVEEEEEEEDPGAPPPPPPPPSPPLPPPPRPTPTCAVAPPLRCFLDLFASLCFCQTAPSVSSDTFFALAVFLLVVAPTVSDDAHPRDAGNDDAHRDPELIASPSLLAPSQHCEVSVTWVVLPAVAAAVLAVSRSEHTPDCGEEIEEEDEERDEGEKIRSNRAEA